MKFGPARTLAPYRTATIAKRAQILFAFASLISGMVALPAHAAPDVEAEAARQTEAANFTDLLTRWVALQANDPALAAMAAERTLSRHFDAANAERALLIALDSGAVPSATAIAHRMAADSASNLSRLVLAAEAMKGRNYRDVTRILSGALYTGDDRLVASTLAALAEMNQGHLEPALRAANEMSAETPADSALRFVRGVILEQAGDKVGALTAYKAAWDGGYRSVALANRYAILLLDKGDEAAAREPIEILEQAGYQTPELVALRAQTNPNARRLSRQDAQRLALTSFVHPVAEEAVVPVWSGFLALEIDPTLDEVRMMLAGRAGENKELVETLLAPIAATSPFFTGATQTLTGYAIERGDKALARQRLDAAIAAAPNVFDLQFLSASLLVNEGQYEGAYDAYTQLLARLNDGSLAGSPSDRAMLLINRGIVAENLDRLDIAESDYRGALRLMPNNPVTQNSLGYFLANHRRDLPEAARLLQRAVSQQPRSGSMIDSLGWAIYQMGHYENAIMFLERAVTLVPTNAIVADHLGDAYWRSGRQMEARMEWRKVLTLIDPTDLESPDPAAIQAKLDNGLPALTNP